MTRAAFGFLSLIGLLAFLAIGSLLFGGCIYKGAKITEGTDLAVGINVPASEGALQLQVLNYLSGFRLGVAENSAMTVEYSTIESNSYFGVINTSTRKDVKASVEPCEDDATAASANVAE